MATLTYPARQLPRTRYDHRFFSAMIITLTVVMVAGFARTYFFAGIVRAPLPARIIHIHGAVFTLWFVLLLAQAGLAASRRVDIHRRLGMAGMFVALAMIPLGLMATAEWARRAAPSFPRIRMALIMPVTELAAFAVLAATAFLAHRHPAAHKRLILLATIALIPAATARLDFIPKFHLHGTSALRLDWAYTYLFVVSIIVFDLASRRRLHPATISGSVFLIALHQVGIAICFSAPWIAFAAWLQTWNL
jgi:hypothetical protein